MMSLLDGSIIVAYLIGMIGLSVYLGRGQSSEEDYFVGGRNLPWWAVGLSTMATQTSAISFISIPAFVALRPGGGLTWLQYELALPLAILLVMALLLPFFRRLELVSVYEYLEHRFNHWMWWNCFGCLTTVFVALLVSRFCTSPPSEQGKSYVLRGRGILEAERRWLPAYLSLSLYFFLMLGSLLVIDALVGFSC